MPRRDEEDKTGIWKQNLQDIFLTKKAKITKMYTKSTTNRAKMTLRKRHPVRSALLEPECDISDGDSDTENRQRELMRPWLLKQINKGGIAGLQWFNKEKMLVKIPWTHGSRQGFDVRKDACLFKRWALHTGKYKEGQQNNPKRWKANFRCAMNSLHDVIEIKEMSKSRGQNAFKIYQFLTEKKVMKKEKKKSEKEPTPQDHYKQYTINADKQEMLRRIKEKVQKKQKERTISDLSMRSGQGETSDYCSGSDETDSIGSDSRLSPQLSVSSGMSMDEPGNQSRLEEHSYASTKSPVNISAFVVSIPSVVEEMHVIDQLSSSHTEVESRNVTGTQMTYTSYYGNQMTSPACYSQAGYGETFDDLPQEITDDVLSMLSGSPDPAENGWNSPLVSSVNSSGSMAALLSADDDSSFSDFPGTSHETGCFLSTGMQTNEYIRDNSKVVVALSNSTYAPMYTAQFDPEQRDIGFAEY